MRIVGHRIRLTKAHMELMRIPRRFWDVDFGMIPECKGQSLLRAYSRNIEDMLNRGEGLLLWGPNGHGKTSAAILVMMEARRHGASALFVQAETLRSGALEDAMFSDEKSLIERAREVDFLVIDDLGKEHQGKSGWADRFFENLIRGRMADKKVTVITTNMAMKPSADKPHEPSLKTKYIASMYEVMKEAMHPVLLRTLNWRDRVQQDMEARLTG